MRVVGLLIVLWVGPFACAQDEAAQELGIEDTSTAPDISAERHADVQPEEQDISGLDIQEPQSPPFQELIDMGLADYLGQAVVDEVTVEDGVTTTKFTVESGPICLRGAPYSMSTRSGPSDELLIFLGGGGACWSDFCAAFDKAPPGIPNGEVLNPELEANPFRTFDMAFLPYCDGSLFAGDATHDDDDDGEDDRIHAGLRNLSAALDVIVEEFPEPSRVVLAGASGGGYGTIVATPLLRVAFPDVPIDIVNDSGPGIARGLSEPEFIGQLIDEFGASRVFPPSCADCIDDGHLTGLMDWSLQQDPNLRIAVFSFVRDFVIGTMFLGLSGPEYEAFLREEMSELNELHPERFQYLLASGVSHTGTFGDITVFGGLIPDSLDSDFIDLAGLEDAAVGDVKLGEWLGWMLTGDERWTSYAAEP
jgi:hypothetical protein